MRSVVRVRWLRENVSCFCSRSAHSPRVVTGSRGRERILPFWPLGRWQVSRCRRIFETSKWTVKLVRTEATAFNLHWHCYGVRQLGVVAKNPIRTRSLDHRKCIEKFSGGMGGVVYTCTGVCASSKLESLCTIRLSGSLHVKCTLYAEYYFAVAD